MRVAFFQCLNSNRVLRGSCKERIKYYLSGGSSITGQVLESALGQNLAGVRGPVSWQAGQYDLAAFSFNTPGAPLAYQIARHLKNRGIITLGGGPHGSLLPEESLQYLDSVCIGPGDGQFARMVKDADEGKLQRIYRAQAGDWAIPQRDRLRGLSLVQLSRGCGYRCSFCVVPELTPGTIDLKPIDLVAAELEQTSKFVNLVDDNFPVASVRGQEILKLLKAADKRFICQISCPAATPENLKLLASSGCTMVGIGLESIRPESQAFLDKPQADDPAAVLHRIHRAGLNSYLNLVFGSDGERPEIFDQTLDFIQRTRPTMISAHLLTPFPGTPLYQQMQRQGRLLHQMDDYPEAWRWADCRHVTFQPDPMSARELTRGFQKFIHQVYSLPRTIRRSRKGSRGSALLSSILKNAW